MPAASGPPIGMQNAANASIAASTMLGGSNQGPGVGANDPLAQMLSGFSANQLVEVLSQMKQLCQQNHNQARHILNNNPQLTKALFQAQIMLGMVQQRAPPAVTAAPPAPAPVPAAYGYAPQPMGTPVPAPAPAAAAQALDPAHQQLLRQVLAMPPEAVNALPPDQRAQVLALQAQARAGGVA